MKWELRTGLTPHQDGCQNFLFNVIQLTDEGEFYVQEKFFTEPQAMARAAYLVSMGRRCEVTKDLAASYGIGDEEE